MRVSWHRRRRPPPQGQIPVEVVLVHPPHAHLVVLTGPGAVQEEEGQICRWGRDGAPGPDHGKVAAVPPVIEPGVPDVDRTWTGARPPGGGSGGGGGTRSSRQEPPGVRGGNPPCRIAPHHGL